MGQITSDLKGCRIIISTLHAELDELLWAMACIREMRVISARFEMDYATLIKMTESPPNWFSRSKLYYLCNLINYFEDFRLIHISRSVNVFADSLVKKVRARDFLFFHISHIKSV